MKLHMRAAVSKSVREPTLEDGETRGSGLCPAVLWWPGAGSNRRPPIFRHTHRCRSGFCNRHRCPRLDAEARSPTDSDRAGETSVVGVSCHVRRACAAVLRLDLTPQKVVGIQNFWRGSASLHKLIPVDWDEIDSLSQFTDSGWATELGSLIEDSVILRVQSQGTSCAAVCPVDV